MDRDYIEKLMAQSEKVGKLATGSFYVGYDFSKTFVKIERGLIDSIKSYIINNKAVIIFWKDGNKTVATVNENDEFDKTIGFGIAMFKYEYRESKNSCKKMLNCIKEYEHVFTNVSAREARLDEINTFRIFMENYINHNTFQNMEKTRKFIKALKESGKRETING